MNKVSSVCTKGASVLRASLDVFTRRLHLLMDPIAYARSQGVQVGEGCWFLSLHIGTFGSEPYLVKLGDKVTVTKGVQFITHDGGVTVFRDRDPAIDVIAPITVGSNVFIGTNAVLMPGITVGDNCVIGAGAIVTRDVPSGSVVVGNPARVICTFEDYYARASRKSVNTGRLSPSEKRQRLLQIYEDDRQATAGTLPGSR